MTRRESAQALARALGLTADEARLLDGLDADHVRQLLTMFERERDRQARELHDAVENGLGLLPRTLRRAVARVFVGFS